MVASCSTNGAPQIAAVPLNRLDRPKAFSVRSPIGPHVNPALFRRPPLLSQPLGQWDAYSIVKDHKPMGWLGSLAGPWPALTELHTGDPSSGPENLAGQGRCVPFDGQVIVQQFGRLQQEKSEKAELSYKLLFSLALFLSNGPVMGADRACDGDRMKPDRPI